MLDLKGYMKMTLTDRERQKIIDDLTEPAHKKIFTFKTLKNWVIMPGILVTIVLIVRHLFFD